MNANAASLRIALVGNPNCGKTALFNLLTGSRQKVANYAGVTVERKEGRFTAPSGRHYQILDLPGAYSFDAASPDEAITRDVCLGRHPAEPVPDLIVCVADATNLRLHLRFVLEVQRLGRPMVVALNMMDAARRRGIAIDLPKLERELGVPVVETVAVKRGGAAALIARIDASETKNERRDTEGDLHAGDKAAESRVVTSSSSPASADFNALPDSSHAPRPASHGANSDLHARVRELLDLAVTMPRSTAAIDDALDRWALHPVWGLAILGAVMFLIFQAVFSWAAPLQDAISAGVAWLGTATGDAMPAGPLRSLVVDGVFAGLGTVLEFLPQILVLFLFILALEESGYLPRAAFLLDRVMFKAGLSGRSFIPLLSSFACAIPGVMATRSIQDPRDRLATILVAPLMTCSARLPVYSLLIGAFIPRRDVFGLFNLQGLVLFALYAAGIVSALVVAWVMKRWRRDRGEHALLLELPSYRLPHPRDLAIGLAERAQIFVRRVGTIILSLVVLLWFLSSFPAPPADATLPAIDYSFAGRIGHALEYVFAPLGFNWQICIALVPGLAAREVAVSSLATVYALSAASDAAASDALAPLIGAQWSLATALSLLVWYIYAPQCLSTLAVIRRETNSWRNVGIAAGYLFALAYGASLVTYQLARWLA